MRKIRVLVVDDSAVVRQTLSHILTSDVAIEVIATASDPFLAAQKLRSEAPDVITLDVEMPKMDGLTFLKKIMSQHPMPVVIISSLTQSGTETALKALEYGAIDIVTKPQLGTKAFLEESRIRICDVVKAAANARVRRRNFSASAVPPKLNAGSVLPVFQKKSMIKTTEKVVAIGASTGGTQALEAFLMAMPSDAPAIVIVQHMPEKFTRSFADRLDKLCKIQVKEAEQGDSIISGRALIAPGNRHLLIKRSGARYYADINDGPLVNRHRPSVDVLFRSAATYAGKNSVGIILTGMGADGATGLLEMKMAGAQTIAQDERSCVVFGMPKEAIKLGAADTVMPLERMPSFVLRAF